MKKRILASFLILAMIFACTACGKKDKADEKFILSKANLDSYITLNEDYDVFDVEIEPIEVTEDEINSQINNLILDKVTSVEELQTLVNREVVNGDTVNIDFVGTKDGVAFDGGTSYTATNLTIGSGSYIPGFEDGLIGKKPGDVVTLDLVFPEDYSSSPELAGQAVQFEVTIHYIVPVYSDLLVEMIPNLYEGCNTEADLRSRVKQDIYDSVYYSSVEYVVVEMMESKATYSENLPQEIRQDSYDNIMTNISTYASYYGFDLETYVYLCYYMDLETFQNETAWELADYNTRFLLYCQAYANNYDLNISDEELEAKLAEYVIYYGLESRESISDDEADSIRNTLMNTKVLEYIVENANVTFKEATEDETVTE